MRPVPLLLVCALTRPALGNEVIVLEVAPGDDARSTALVARVAAAIGADAAHGPALRARIVERVSSSPSDPTARVLAELQALVEEGIQDFYHNEFARSVDKLSRASDALQEAIDRVGQDELVSRHLFESRLILAVALQRDGQPDRAVEILRQCIQTFPDLHPGRAQFAPDVIRLYEELKERMDAHETGLVEISTDPWGCAVLRDGQYVGVTPLPPLRTYRGPHTIQVRCGELPLRVRRVVVGAGLQRVRVNARADATLRTDGETARLLAGAGTLPAALEVGRALEAGRVVLVHRNGARARLELVDVARGRVIARSEGDDGRAPALVRGLYAPREAPRPSSRGIDLVDVSLLGAACVGVLGGTAIAIASTVPGTTCGGGPVDDGGDCRLLERPGNLWPVAGMISAGAALGGVLLIRALADD